MKIGQQGKIQAAELLGKRSVGVHAVNADAQNLGVELREARQVILQRAKLTSSSAGEIERVESQDRHMAAYVGQRQRALAEMRGQREVGRKIAYHQFLIRHGPLLHAYAFISQTAGDAWSSSQAARACKAKV